MRIATSDYVDEVAPAKPPLSTDDYNALKAAIRTYIETEKVVDDAERTFVKIFLVGQLYASEKGATGDDIRKIIRELDDEEGFKTTSDAGKFTEIGAGPMGEEV